ncbi:MAG: hypothetical protein WDZ30_07250 [Cellvibrionaceae bacterium]
MQGRVLLMGITLLLPLSCYGDYTIELSLDNDSDSSEIKSQSYVFFNPDPSFGGAASVPVPATQVTEVESDSNTLRGRLYFGRVSTADLPLAEAGLFSKQGNASLSIESSDTRSKVTWRPERTSGFASTPLDASSTGRGTAISSDVELVTPGPPFIVGLGLATGESKTDSDSSGGGVERESDFRATRLQLGFFVNDRATLRYHYTKQDTEGDAALDRKRTSHDLSVRQLVSLSNGQYLSVWGGYAISTTEFEGAPSNMRREQLGVGLSYYPIRALKLSIGYRKSRQVDGVDNDNDEYHYGLGYFFSDTVALSLQVSKAESDYAAPDTGTSSTSTSMGELASEGIRLGVDLRF